MRRGVGAGGRRPPAPLPCSTLNNALPNSVTVLLNKTQAAFTESALRLFKTYGKVYLWTFTFVNTPASDWAANDQWKTFHMRLKRAFPNMRGLRVTELHRRHGFHYPWIIRINQEGGGLHNDGGKDPTLAIFRRGVDHTLRCSDPGTSLECSTWSLYAGGGSIARGSLNHCLEYSSWFAYDIVPEPME